MDIENLRDRVYQKNVEGDGFKSIYLGLEDIDHAVLYYFKNIIKPNIIQNGVKIDVPVVYGNPERWFSVQKEGYYRDEGNKIMAPFIMYKMDDLSPDLSVTNKIDANLPRNYIVFSQRYNRRNAYDNFDVLNNRIPEQEYFLTVVPDYVRIKYSCVIITYYKEQLNKLIEAINYASNSYWGDPKKFKFKTRVTNFSTPIEVKQEGERTVRCSFDLQLFGYIIPDSLNKEVNSIKKISKKTKFRIKNEVVGSLEDIKKFRTIHKPPRYKISNVNQPEGIQVPLGTSIGELGLPTHLTLSYSIGETKELPVTWESLGYNPDELGVYTFLAHYSLPYDVSGDKPTIYMTVQVGEGTIVDPDEFLRVENRLSEFDTPQAKYEARVNLELQIIDEGEY